MHLAAASVSLGGVAGGVARLSNHVLFTGKGCWNAETLLPARLASSRRTSVGASRLPGVGPASSTVADRSSAT